MIINRASNFIIFGIRHNLFLQIIYNISINIKHENIRNGYYKFHRICMLHNVILARKPFPIL